MLKNTANMGRFGDTEMAHVSPGEVVVPRPVLENNPNLGAGIATAIENMGGNPERYVVGSQSNSVNPDTGNPEYFWKELLTIGKSIFGSKAGQDIITNVALQKLMGGKVNAGQALASGLVGGLSGDSGFFGESGGQQKPKINTVAKKASNVVESIAPVAKRAKAEGTMGIGSLLGDAVAGKGKDNFLSNLLNSKGGEALLFGLGSTFLDKMFGKEEEEPGRRPFGGTTEFRPILGGYNYGGQVYQRRDGGIMPSEGSGTEDDVPAMLTAGEFVLTKKAVEGLGNGNLDRGIQNGYKLMNNLEGKSIMPEVIESINRRPEYIEEREKALLDQIFGKYNEETGEYEGGTMHQEDLFRVPEYRQPGLDPLETKALDLAGSEGFINRYSPYFDKSTEAIGGGLDTMEKGAGYFDDARASVDAGTGTFDPATATSKFMNPYRQNVIDEAMSQIDRQGQIAQNNLSAKAIQSGAFGGSREGIQRAENDRNILAQKSQTIAGLLDKGYGDALKTSLGSFEEEKKRNLEAGRLTGGLGSSLSGVGANMGNVGGTAADVGRVYGSMGPADLKLMAGLGGGKRAYDAEGIEIARKEAQRPLEEANRPIAYGYDALKGTPSSNLYNTYRPQPVANPFLSGIGAYTAIQGINQA